MKLQTLLLSGCLMASAAVQAESALSYQNLTVGYAKAEVDNTDFSGLVFEGSLPLSDNVFITAGFSDVNSDDEFNGDDINLSILSLGGGFHARVSPNTDVVVRFEITDNEAKHKDTETLDESGRNIGVSIRSKLAEKFELEAGVVNTEVDDEDDNLIVVSGRFFVSPKASVGLSIADGDDSNTRMLDLRFDF